MGKKKIADFAADIYFTGRDQLRDRLARGWKAAIKSENPVEEVYMLFRLEGYDATYEECVKLVKVYNKMEDNPPWEEPQQGGPVSY